MLDANITQLTCRVHPGNRVDIWACDCGYKKEIDRLEAENVRYLSILKTALNQVNAEGKFTGWADQAAVEDHYYRQMKAIRNILNEALAPAKDEGKV